jgi:glycosylphosphatidylinositol transamidase
MLERLHASYFFYLLPSPGHFIPVGNYLPSAILLGSSVVIGGLACPQPPSPVGLAYIALAYVLGGLGLAAGTPDVAIFALLIPRPEGKVRETIISLTHLLHGAMIPTLAMLNFPQALALATVTIAYLAPYRLVRWTALGLLHPCWAHWGLRGMEEEWRTLGNMFWPGVFVVWVPLWVIAAII